MAHKKGGGSSRNGRDSNAQRLGIKRFGGELVPSGAILVRQKGTRIQPGEGVGLGRDYTIYALAAGQVVFQAAGRDRRRVSVVPVGNAASSEEAGKSKAPAESPV